MARSQRTKITLKDIGEPALVKTLPPAEHQYVLGTLIGIASKFVERNSPDGQDKFEGLGGTFRVIPADPQRDELESGILFIPDAFHNMIASVLRKGQDNDPNFEVKFAFEVSSVKANNAAGYSWDFKPMIENAAENPLDNFIETAGIMKQVGKTTQAAITQREESKPAAAKPADKAIAKK